MIEVAAILQENANLREILEKLELFPEWFYDDMIIQLLLQSWQSVQHVAIRQAKATLALLEAQFKLLNLDNSTSSQRQLQPQLQFPQPQIPQPQPQQHFMQPQQQFTQPQQQFMQPQQQFPQRQQQFPQPQHQFPQRQQQFPQPQQQFPQRQQQFSQTQQQFTQPQQQFPQRQQQFPQPQQQFPHPQQQFPQPQQQFPQPQQQFPQPQQQFTQPQQQFPQVSENRASVGQMHGVRKGPNGLVQLLEYELQFMTAQRDSYKEAMETFSDLMDKNEEEALNKLENEFAKSSKLREEAEALKLEKNKLIAERDALYAKLEHVHSEAEATKQDWKESCARRKRAQ